VNKQDWKIYYRMLRIYRREAGKAWMDMLTFGMGHLDMAGAEPRYIPIEEIKL